VSKPNMQMVKCFNTAGMPEEVAAEMLECLGSKDVTEHWVSVELDSTPAAVKVCEWFLSNGAAPEEKVIVARGQF
jgi:hypothetical protein